MANPEAFEAYFRTADVDQDGNISGAEAVAFFRGFNLPQVTLAKIWQFSDQGRRGFLSKPEFYNALKLVTVAQSGRELTPELVRAALFGPASTQIPAPRIVSGPAIVSIPGGYGAATQATGPISSVQQVPVAETVVSQSQPPKTTQAVPVPQQVQPKPGLPLPRISTTVPVGDPWVLSKPFSPTFQVRSPGSSAVANNEPKQSPVPVQPGLQDTFAGTTFQAYTKVASTPAPFQAPPVGDATSSAGVQNAFPVGTSSKVETAYNNGTIASDSKSPSFSEVASKVPPLAEVHSLSVESKVGADTFSAFSREISNNQVIPPTSGPDLQAKTFTAFPGGLSSNQAVPGPNQTVLGNSFNFGDEKLSTLSGGLSTSQAASGLSQSVSQAVMNPGAETFAAFGGISSNGAVPGPSQPVSASSVNFGGEKFAAFSVGPTQIDPGLSQSISSRSVDLGADTFSAVSGGTSSNLAAVTGSNHPISANTFNSDGVKLSAFPEGLASSQTASGLSRAVSATAVNLGAETFSAISGGISIVQTALVSTQTVSSNAVNFGGEKFSAFSEGLSSSQAPPGISLSVLEATANVGAEAFSAFAGGDSHEPTSFTPSQAVPIHSANAVSFQSNFDGRSLLQTQVSPAIGNEVHGLASVSQLSSVRPVVAGFTGTRLAADPIHGVSGAWPKMSRSDVLRYNRVFSEVDTDKDGKILGEQARDLFLSWRLPREVLKQVWDLSDQDADSMLSFREFCTALYLMERYREGRALPSSLPVGIHLEDDLQRQPTNTTQAAEAQTAVVNNPAGHNVSPWKQNPSVLSLAAGFVAQTPQVPAPQLPSQTHFSQVAGTESSQVYKSKAPILELNLVKQLNKDEQEILKQKYNEAEEADNKVHHLEKEILDSQQKIEFYRARLQEVILFKSRCDNHLAELTERSAADKKELETLAKKYDDKFRQAGEVNSRLLAEEAAFRDIQERKMELYKAVSQIEQDGNANSLLQSRADRISDDFDELRKTFAARIKSLGLRSMSAVLTEPAFGWQAGVQESAVEWDDDWDKFDDEGFVPMSELSDYATAATDVTKITLEKTPSTRNEGALSAEEVSFTAEPLAESKYVSHIEKAPALTQISSEIGSPGAESEPEWAKSTIESPQYDVFSPREQSAQKDIFENLTTERKSDERDESPYPQDSGDGFATFWPPRVPIRNENGQDHQESGDGFATFWQPRASTSSRDEIVHDHQESHEGFATFWPPRLSTSNSISGDTSADLPSWASAFDGHNEEANSLSASWGLKSKPHEGGLDFTVSQPVSSLQTGPSFISHSFGESPDFASLRVSSAARGNGVPQNEFDHFGSPGTKEWQDKSGEFFQTDGSAPGTPPFSTTSPRRTSLFGEDFSRGRNSFSRFDSISSVRDGDRMRGLGSFDDSDLFADTGPFRATTNATKSSDNWSTF